MRLPKTVKSVTVVAALITVAGGLIAVWLSTHKSEASLQLVAVDLGMPPTEPHLDVKVRNIGERQAFIKAVELRVTREWTLQPLNHPTALLTSSAQYMIPLPPRPAPFTAAAVVSQVVDAGAVDRFGVTLASNDVASDPRRDVHRILVSSISLIYNEDGRRVTSDSFLLAVGRPWAKLMYCDDLLAHWKETIDTRGDPRPRIRENRRIGAEIARQPGRRAPLTAALLEALSCPTLDAIVPRSANE